MNWVHWDGFFFGSWRLSVGNSKCVVCVIVFVIVFVFLFVVLLVKVMSPHHSDQMSQRSQVSGIAL